MRFTATVSPEFSGTPTGTVKVQDPGNQTLCTITLTTGDGSCSPGNTVLGAGRYQAIARYSGDTDFKSSDTSTGKATRRKPAQVCVITLRSGAGSCTLPARALRPGTYRLTATYDGSRNILTSDSPMKILTVRK